MGLIPRGTTAIGSIMAKRITVPIDFASADDEKNAYIEMLMYHLSQHAPFMNNLDELGNYPLATQRFLHAVKELASSTIEVNWDKYKHEEQRQIKEYYRKLEAMVERYRLNPEWAMGVIHEGVNNIQSMFLAPGITVIDEQLEDYTITWNLDSGLNKKQIEKYVLAQFENQWAEFEERAKEEGYRKVHKKWAMKEHTYAVFRHVCLGMTWNDITEETDGVDDVDTVRKPAQEIMKSLGLNSKRRRGNPNK